MAFTIPQAQSNPTWPAQAVPDSTDFAVITAGENGTGIISGLATTIASSSAYTYKVTVATGTYLISGTQYTLAAAVTGTGTVANTVGDRRDLVSVNSVGTITITTGSACAVTNWSTTSSVDPPVKPTIPTGNIALAEVYVPGSGSYTTPAATWVTDKSLVLTQYLTTSGGTMSGNIAMGSNKVTGLATATTAGDAMNYGLAAGGALGGTYPNPTIARSDFIVAYLTSDITGVTSAGIATVSGWTVLSSGGTNPTIAANGTITLPSAGLWQISAGFTYNKTGTAQGLIALRVSGSAGLGGDFWQVAAAPAPTGTFNAIGGVGSSVALTTSANTTLNFSFATPASGTLVSVTLGLEQTWIRINRLSS